MSSPKGSYTALGSSFFIGKIIIILCDAKLDFFQNGLRCMLLEHQSGFIKWKTTSTKTFESERPGFES